MKKALTFSIILNLALAGAVVLLSFQKRQTDSVSVDVASNALVPTAPMVAQQPKAEAKPFRWSELESSDYRAYVTNLRDIGCPDQTLRDIIQADVDSLYSSKRRQLSLSEAGPGPWSRQEETRLINSLVGEPPGMNHSSMQASAAGTNIIAIPLVLQNVDLSSLALDPGQRQAVVELREQFVAQIGGTNQDPSDPAYRERWLQLQPESDEMLRGMIGINAFQNYQLQAAGTPPEAY